MTKRERSLLKVSALLVISVILSFYDIIPLGVVSLAMGLYVGYLLI